MTINILMPLFIIIAWCGISYLLIAYRKMTNKGHRNPLTRQLLRSPGEYLRTKIEDLSFDLLFYLMMLLILPLYIYAAYVSQAHRDSKLFIVSIIATCIGLFFFIYKLLKVWKDRNNLHLGLDCEMAVGQELNQLMREGCYVFHDFPAEGFNIDHVVVSTKGVLAIETKGRAKPDKVGGSAEATVVYDGEALKFPGWVEKEPIDQAMRQAKWLAKWLSSAVGEQIATQPVLALPGWFIERTKPSSGLILFNGKNPNLLLKWIPDTGLSEVLMKRINHQLEQRCRDMEPVAYPKKAKDK